MLVGALVEHEGALRASLRAEYGIDLRNPGMGWHDLADMVRWLPAGCPLWQATGGPLALSTEVHAILAVRHGTDVLAWQNTGIMQHKPRGKAPKPMPDPPYAAELKAQQERAEAKRDRYLKRRRAVEG